MTCRPANERQRDLFVGVALTAGLLESRPLHARIVVVPYGLDAEPPRSGGPVT